MLTTQFHWQFQVNFEDNFDNFLYNLILYQAALRILINECKIYHITVMLSYLLLRCTKAKKGGETELCIEFVDC